VTRALARSWLALALAAAPIAARPAHPTTTEEVHVPRLLAVTGLTWSRRAAPDLPMLGLVYQLSLTKTHVWRDGRGEHIEGPRWFLHAGLMGGVNFFSYPHGEAFGALGLLYRPADAPAAITSFGLVGVGSAPEPALGPAARVELLDLIGLQAGPVFREGTVYAFVSIDLMYGLLSDVGLLHL
jgi:hypothetical protein